MASARSPPTSPQKFVYADDSFSIGPNSSILNHSHAEDGAAYPSINSLANCGVADLEVGLRAARRRRSTSPACSLGALSWLYCLDACLKSRPPQTRPTYPLRSLPCPGAARAACIKARSTARQLTHCLGGSSVVPPFSVACSQNCDGFDVTRLEDGFGVLHPHAYEDEHDDAEEARETSGYIRACVSSGLLILVAIGIIVIGQQYLADLLAWFQRCVPHTVWCCVVL